MAQTDSKTTDRRKKRLPQTYYNTASRLRMYLFSEDHIGASTKQTAKEYIARLVTLSGVTPPEDDPDAARGWPEECALKEAARAYHFDMPEDDPRRAEWSSAFDALRELADLSFDLWRARWDVERMKTAQAETPKQPQPKQHVTKINSDDHSREYLGLLPGDELHVIECDDFRAGELVVLWEQEEKEWEGVGTFHAYVDGEEWGPRCPRISTGSGRHTYNPEVYEFYRIAKITRHITVERLSDGDGEAAITRQKIQSLRDRLEKIDADDITNCSARLALETQIYNLEHPPKLDDWSEWEEPAAETITA